MKQQHTWKIRFGTFCAFGLLSALGIGSLTASAYTPGEVAAYAYSINYPNASSYVNQAYAAIQSGKLTQAQIDAYCASAMATLQQWNAERQQNVDDILNGGDSDSPDSTSTTAAADSSSSTTTQTTAAGSSSDSSSDSDSNSSGNSTSGSNSSSSGSTSGGSTSTGTMSDSDFTKLSLDEKISYVNSLSGEERTNFVNSLSNEAKNSILKQMGTDRQLEMVSEMLDASSDLGLNFSVDSVSDDGIVISTRDADGNLVDVTTYGNSVEATGIPYTMPVLVGVGAILLAGAGLGTVLWYSKRKDDQS